VGRNSNKNKPKTKLTLMLLGLSARPPLKIELTPKKLGFFWSSVALVSLLLFLLIFFLVNNSMMAKSLLAQNKSLLAQNLRLSERGAEKDEQLALLSDKLRAIELTLERIEETEGRVRILSGIPENSLPLITEGGPVTPRVKDNVSQTDLAKLHASATEVMTRMNIHRASLRKTARFFIQRNSRMMQIPSQWPVTGWVTSVFGMRISPFTGRAAMHNGIDIAAPEGTIIRAPASGQIIFSGSRGGYGLVVVMQHGRGITTLYGHLAKSLLEEGVEVAAGAPIALVGNTGRSTGPHLHYEVRLNNVPVNPTRFLPDRPQDDPDMDESDAKTAPTIAPLTQKTTWPSEPIPAQPAEPTAIIPPTIPEDISAGE